MRLTFPQLGDAHLVGRLFFHEIGVDLISPPPNTGEGLARGAALSPEEMCLPFKLMMNNLLNAWELGADTVLMPATMGPCRLGEYAELLKVLLEKEGCQYQWILMDTPDAIGVGELLKRIRMLVCSGGKHPVFLLRKGMELYRLNARLERFLARLRALSGYEADRSKGSLKQLGILCRKKLSQAETLAEGRGVLREYERKLKGITLDRSRKPVRVLVTGEIFSSIEPFANHRIEELLMDLGVSFEKPVTIGWWIRRTIVDPLGLFDLRRRRNPYMPYEVGGYARDTIGESLRSIRRSFDGVIQVLPAGCMPEIVAKSVFSRVSRERDLKVLSVIFDEMAGEAGYMTRVEAFVDLLQRLKKRNNLGRKKTGHVLFGN